LGEAEQPQDPKLYRTAEEIKEKGFMSMWRTQEWCDFAKTFQANLVHFDQGPMGHECRKPTTLAVIGLSELHQLQDVRGKGVGPPVEGQQPPRPRNEMEMNERIAQSKSWACWAHGLKAAIAEALRRWMFAKAPPRDSVVLQPAPTIRSVGAVALQQWKQHYLQDHMPARRDCSHCLRAQGRSPPHKRVEHPEAFTLSLDLSGKLDKGKDQSLGNFKYILVGVYTYPVTKRGQPLIPQPGEDEDEQDHPLPDPGDFEIPGDLDPQQVPVGAQVQDPQQGDDGVQPEAAIPEDPLHEEARC
jgi:hypothetical protein